MSGINQAQISFREDGTPVSADFDDVYFSREGGAAESRFTFFDAADVCARWAGRDLFTVGETGFGTGLNFFVTLAAWRRDKQAPKRLEFLTIEGWPLTLEQAAQAHAAFPELAEEAAALQAVWPTPGPGLIRVELYGGRVGLTIGMGEAEAMFSQMRADVDAWYLDGFAPAKNPEMWREAVLQHIARLSAPNAQLASFTAAGAVRRGLDAVGFDVERRPGFGRKRHSISGKLRDGAGGEQALQPWQIMPVPRGASEGQIAVIGAGIAGACVAARLAEMGSDVVVYSAGQRPGNAASGNPRGIVMPRLTAEWTPAGELYTASLRFARQLYQSLSDVDQDWCGALELIDSADKAITRAHRCIEQAALPAGWVEFVEDASKRNPLIKPLPALWHSHAGWIAPGQACRALLKDVEQRHGVEVTALRRSAANGWELIGPDSQTLAKADQVVLAAGADLPVLLGRDGEVLSDWQPPLSLSRGQITQFTTAAGLSSLDHVLIGEGYVLPADSHGQSCVGASFERIVAGDPDGPVTETGHQDNLQRAETALADGMPSLSDVQAGRTGRRLATADRLPLCGPVPNQPLAEQAWEGWHRRDGLGEAPSIDGLWVLSALGARGLTTAPLLAALLVQQMFGGPWPVGQQVAEAVDPRRFILRALRRAG